MIHDPFSKRIILSFWGIWFLSLLLSTFNPYGLYSVSNETYWILLLNVSGFILGFSIVDIDKNIYNGKNAYSCFASFDRFISSKKFFLIICLGVILCGMLLNKYLYGLLYLTTSRTESMTMVSEDISSPDYVFYSFLGAPLFYCSNVVLAYSLIYNRKLLIDILIFIYVIIFALIGGGRVAFLVIVISIVFILFMEGKKIYLRKLLLPFVGCVLLVYVLMAYLTAFRNGLFEFTLDNIFEGASILNENFVTYLTLPFRLFDYAYHNDYLSQAGGYSYGLISFDGINRYLRLFLRLFSIDIPAIYEKTTAMFQDTWVATGKDMVSNYAYTNAIYHYLDFGILGVFMIPFSFSAFFRWIIKKFYEKGAVSGLCLMFYLYYVLIHSVFSWHLNKLYSLGFIIILTLLLCKNNENKGVVRTGK